MARKKQAAEGSLSGSIFLGGVSALIGVLIGFVNLLNLDVQEVKEIPEAEEIDTKAVYYIAGSQRGGSAWKTKRSLLARGRVGTLTFTEGELNSWARSSFKPDPKSEEPSGGFLGITAEQMNFRIFDGQMQVSARVKSSLIPGGKSYLFQSTGTFAKSGDQFAFVPDRAVIATCPIPGLGGVASMAFGMFMPAFVASKEYTELNPSWAALLDVAVAGNKLNLVHP